MARTPIDQSIASLKQAFAEQRLTLFLGAGVSVANGLPTWEKLVLSLYFATIGEQNMGGWRPFANYLYAISEWHMRHSTEPLEVTARKVRSFYKDSEEGDKAFLGAIRDAIYGVNTYMAPGSLLRANATLDSIVKLCAAKRNRRFGVRSVITYNYDNLLEMTLVRKRPYKAVYSKDGDFGDHLPVFHVHGYVPHHRGEIDRRNAAIIFTEEQYNIVASDPYSWSNIVQLREMSSSVGLMIGLSLSDRNIRRLLDALNQSPIRPKIFALLKVPDQKTASNEEMDGIHHRAIEIFDRFEQSGIKGVGIKSPRGAEKETGFQHHGAPSRGIDQRAVKSSAPVGRKSSARLARKSSAPLGRKTGVKGADRRVGEPRYRREIRGIIEQVESLEQKQYQNILEQLGIVPIWYDEHSEIPRILAQIR